MFTCGRAFGSQQTCWCFTVHCTGRVDVTVPASEVGTFTLDIQPWALVRRQKQTFAPDFLFAAGLSWLLISVAVSRRLGPVGGQQQQLFPPAF